MEASTAARLRVPRLRSVRGRSADCKPRPPALVRTTLYESLALLHTSGGSEPVGNFAATLGSDQDSCCTCPAGTTAVYGDENLAFRFRPENITTAADGSVRWPAIEPPGLAFTMTRYEEPPEHYDPSEAATYYSAGNASEPTRVLPASDVIPGLLWDHGEGADGVDVAYDQGAFATCKFICEALRKQHAAASVVLRGHFLTTFAPIARAVMYSNLKLAYGVKSTMFIVVTPTRIPPLWAALVLFRPGSNIPGNMVR